MMMSILIFSRIGYRARIGITSMNNSLYSICRRPWDFLRSSLNLERKKKKKQVIGQESEFDWPQICRICFEHYDGSGEKLIAPCKCKGTLQFVHQSCLDHWRSIKEGFAFAHCTTCRAQFHLHINVLEGSFWRNVKFHMFVARDIFLSFLALQTIISTLGGLSYLCDLNGRFRKYISCGWDYIFSGYIGHDSGHRFSNHSILFYYGLGTVIFFALLGIFGSLLECSQSGMTSGSPTGTTSGAPADTSTGTTSVPRNGSHSKSNSDFDSDSDSNSDFDSDSDSNSKCESDAASSACAVLVSFVISFAVIGIFKGISAATVAILMIWKRHYHILTKRELTKEYVVEDLHGCYMPPQLNREHADSLRKLGLL